jgi:hypothetical protein
MNTNLYYTALNNGYIYIPGYCFQSKINYTIDNKASIVRYWNFTDLSSVFGVTKNSANNLDKTIAIQYYGSDGTNSNKYSFFRQFWLEDIKTINSSSIGNDTNYFGKDAGIFVRNLNDIKNIISNSENTSNYDWINTVLNPITFDASNFNMLDKVQFVMVLDGYFVKSWLNDNLTKLQTFTTNYGTNRPDDSTLNGSLIFQLEKQNTINSDNNFALKAYQNGKWNYITCNYYGGNNICGFTTSPEYRIVNITNNNNGFEWGPVRIKKDWSDWNVCAQTGITNWYNSPKYKIIQPNYDYIFSKLPIVFNPIITATTGEKLSSTLNITNIDKNNPNNIQNLANVSKYNVKLYETGTTNIIKSDTLSTDKNIISHSVVYSGLENKKYTWNVTSTSIILDGNSITSNPSMFDVIPITPPKSLTINSASVSDSNSVNLNFSKNSDGGSPISSYTVTSYYDGGCGYRNVSSTDTNLKTNTDGTLTYNYPVSSRKSYTGNLNNLPTNCFKEGYDYLDIKHKPMISYFSTENSISNNKHKIKENYIFTLSATNNIGQSPVSFTKEDVIPLVSVSPTGPNVPVSPTGPNVPVSPTGPNVPVSPTGPNVPVSPTGPGEVIPPTPTPYTSTSKYLIISVIIVFIILIIIAGFFIFKK